jgi:HD-GYP domain-containing protein (c-di-GMP phosphodiesterase class II)
LDGRAKNLREEIYTWLVIATGMFLLFTNRPVLDDPMTVVKIVFMGILIAIGEASPVVLPNNLGTVSVSLPISIAVAVLYGPEVGMWMASLGTLRKQDLTGKIKMKYVLFNRAMIAISMYSFCYIYDALGGTYATIAFSQGFIPFVVAACVYTVVNAILATGWWSLHFSQGFWVVWRSNIRWGLPNMMALVPVGMVMVLAAQSQEGGPWLLILFYLPIMVSKYSLDKYMELRTAYREMAAALSNAIDARDSYTRGHSERVSEYAARLAAALKLPDDQIDTIRYVGLLHDVGKVGIRDAIMKKQGTFTLDEYEEMKNHANIGADMLAGLKFLGKGQDWVRYHHERWDGHGFPKGLAGEEIPIEARILACADSFDAMTTDRPYKAKMDLEAAKRELLRCSGTQFDPKVVEAMVKVIDKMKEEGS